MVTTAHVRLFARGLVGSVVDGASLFVTTQPISRYDSLFNGSNLSMTGVWGGAPSYPVLVGADLQNASGQWEPWSAAPYEELSPKTIASGEVSYSISSNPYRAYDPANPAPAGPVDAFIQKSFRLWAQAPGEPKVYTSTAVFQWPVNPDVDPGDPDPPTPTTTGLKGPADYVYPTVPTVGSTVDGAIVVEVNNATQLAAAIGSNKYIILNDGNYWTGSTWIVASRANLTLHARNRHGARFAAGSYNNTNAIHFALCDDLDLIGLDFAKTGYYSIRFGGDNLYYGGNPYGPNRRVRVLGCRFDDLTTGAIKLDNGYGNGSASPYLSTDIEIGYCQISRTGQAPPSSNIYFSEGIYMGDGTYPYYQRVDGVNIHHCLIDGTLMNTGSGEAIEAKVYCRNIVIADNEIKNWQLGDSTSGGAIALSINRGTNIAPGVVPDNGANGYKVLRNRIHGTRRLAGTTYAKASAISLGHGNSLIENNMLWNNYDGGLIFVNHTAAHTGIFSNPAQLRVDVKHNTILGNGSNGQYGANWSPDTSLSNSQYFAQVYSVNNAISGGTNYFTGQGVTWMQQQDAWNVTASQLVASSFTTTNALELKPTSDGILVSGTNANVPTDIIGNPRPSGQRQFGAIEVQA